MRCLQKFIERKTLAMVKRLLSFLGRATSAMKRGENCLYPYLDPLARPNKDIPSPCRQDLQQMSMGLKTGAVGLGSHYKWVVLAGLNVPSIENMLSLIGC